MTRAGPRVALFLPTIDQIGGAERQVLLLANELAARNWDVTLIALSGAATPQSGLLRDDVSYLSLGMRKAWIDPRGWLRYLTWAAERRPDVVHAHLPHATWFVRWVRLLAPVRVLIDTLHTSHTGGLARRLGYRLSDPLSDSVTCVGASVQSAARDAGIANPHKLSVLPNGVVMPSRVPDRNSIQFANAAFHWIAVGRLAPVKDYSTLIRAFALLPENALLRVIGIGPEELALRSLAAHLNVASRIDFAGFHRDVQPLLAAADGFVLSSRWEGLPMGVIEAQAAGLPVVATDAAGTRNALPPDQVRALVPVGDASALATAMSSLMTTSPSLRSEMASRGRQFVQENFSLSSVVDRWERLYHELLYSQPEPSRIGRHPLRRFIGASSSAAAAATGSRQPSANEKLDPELSDRPLATPTAIDPRS